ncbi:hypothetical protein AVEN_256779-1 [Araneus ventricosus]|uniref:Uncharacterized protein n=1 Tax=Araneus ventricosus TaxID=182803 RepID=A0A4Y2VK35_ARAVE|nr:hypothetical protein AVEN_256779-1 [Araneus ventricosus]
MAIQNSNLPPSFVNEVVKILEDETIIRSNLKSVSDVYSWVKEYGRTLNKGFTSGPLGSSSGTTSELTSQRWVVIGEVRPEFFEKAQKKILPIRSMPKFAELARSLNLRILFLCPPPSHACMVGPSFQKDQALELESLMAQIACCEKKNLRNLHLC